MLQSEVLAARIADLKSRVTSGGLHEALVRSALYIGMTRGRVDERGFEMIKRVRDSNAGNALSLVDFKKMVREQFFMLLLDQKAAVEAIPSLLPTDEARRLDALNLIREILSASGEIAGETRTRLDEIEFLFGRNEHSKTTLVTSIEKFQPKTA